VTIDDAELLAEDPEDLARDVQRAADRLDRHRELEAARREAKLKTDIERWVDGEEYRD